MKLRGKVTKINLGVFEIEGIMLTSDQPITYANAKFFVAVPQISKLFSLVISNASKDIKRILGEGLPLVKIATDLNSKYVNCLSIDSLAKLIFELALRGNPKAIELGRLLTGLSLHQLFCDAFQIESAAKDRVIWLQTRSESKTFFWEFADAIKLWIESRKCSAPAYTYYASAYDAINVGLFGKTSREIREELGIGDQPLIRDHFGKQALRRLITTQASAASRLNTKKASNPTIAAKMAVERVYEGELISIKD